MDQTLMQFLKALKREGAEVIHWTPKYEKDDEGELNGFITITISVKEKKSET